GFGGSELALVEGAIAGHAAVDERDAARRLWPRRRRWQGFADTLARHFALRAELRQLAEADTLVCRCEDVPLAALAGHAGWTEAKLHSRCGMGACQGRICGSAAQFLFGWTPPAPRPPFSPARLETLACWQGDAG
ncbi:TPA: FAD/NAD(P)-binding oxidoreductase, partial [Pseudomonas aeruginosa]|nr:FAD/NAD(P)-binding oxidoreductase [Pseudomonas aeruginosa]